MHDAIKFRVQRMKRCTATIACDLAFIEAWHDALQLAFRERTGSDLEDGAEYSAADERRADEIMELYPRSKA
jgi:hypothetical protein